MLIEAIFNHLLEGLATTSERKETVRRLVAKGVRVVQWLTRYLAGGYFLCLLVLWLLFRHVGEQNLALAFGLYLPPAVWGLPLMLVIPAVLLFDWKSLGFVTGSVVLISFGLMGVEWHTPRQGPAGAPVLKVLTFNRGESVGSLQGFKNSITPDVILLQDAYNGAERYVKRPGYEEFPYGDSIGQFTLVSRFPVLEKELIVHDGLLVAGRFKIDWNRQPVVIYDIHLPTPRGPLRALSRGAFLWGLPGPWAGKRDSYESWWHAQIGHAEAIMQRAAAETLPCIIAGDSNAPSHGYVHSLMTRQFIDSHEAAGSGCGMSFPGTTHNPLSLGGPWMRIDKVLCSGRWLPLWNKAEPDRPSQHRAVAAAFALSAR